MTYMLLFNCALKLVEEIILYKFLSYGPLSEPVSCRIVPHCVLTCLPLRRRDWDRPIVVVIASGLLADEVLVGLTVVSVPIQIWCFQSHTAIL